MRLEILDKLPTRDGRKYGNAVVVGHAVASRLARDNSDVYELFIDGESVMMSEEDIKINFYPANGKADKADIESKLTPRYVVLRISTVNAGHGTTEDCFEAFLGSNGELPVYSLKTAKKLCKCGDYYPIRVALGKEIPESSEQPVGLS